MPIYNFECPQCKKKFERIVKMNDKVCVCDECGCPMAYKIAAPTKAGFRLKGKDWYATSNPK